MAGQNNIAGMAGQGRVLVPASGMFGHIPDAELLPVEVALAPADGFYRAIKLNGWHHNPGWG